MLQVDEARARLCEGTSPVATTERIGVAQGLGRILAEDLHAPIDLPPFENSAMDGYAVHSEDAAFQGEPPHRLEVVGTSFAGAPWQGDLMGGAVRIFTGGAMPKGADAVILQEDAEASGKFVTFNAAPPARAHVRPVGDDITRGMRLFATGDRLRAFELGWAAACGVETLEVFTRPRIGIFATGDELREPGTSLAHGQIYESNRLMLRSLCASSPVEVCDLGILSDDREELLDSLEKAAAEHDMLITSGGVSVGDSDFVREVVEALGSIAFWRVAIKPGKPFATGRIGKCLFMGLPGNPASAVVTFLLFVAPAIIKLCGAEPEPPLEVEARLTSAINPPKSRTEYQRGRYLRAAGGLEVRPTGSQGSNRIGSFRDANCLIKLPPGTQPRAKGSQVCILPFGGLIGGA